jgi:hypothetical protein
VSVQRGGAVGAEDPQVLEAVVVRDAVDVIDDQRHALAPPKLTLAALLAAALLEPLAEETLLEVLAAVRRVADEDLGDRDRLSAVRRAPPRRAKMAGVDAPPARVALDRRGVAAGGAIAEPAQGLRPGDGRGDRPLELLPGEPGSAFHEHMFVFHPDGNSPYTQARSGVV